MFFFFQAEDGIRDKLVTGVQTCALPIYSLAVQPSGNQPSNATPRRISFTARVNIDLAAERSQMFDDAWRTMKYRFYDPARSEERRVGKECRSRWSPE